MNYLEAIGVQFYRGIGPEPQYIAPLSRMNFFVGVNNAGKSIVLEVVHGHLPFRAGEKPKVVRSLNGTERYRGEVDGQMDVLVGVPVGRYFDVLDARDDLTGSRLRNCKEALQLLLAKVARDGYVWVRQSSPDGGVLPAILPDTRLAEDWLPREMWRDLWSALTRKTGGDLRGSWVPGVLKAWFQLVQPSYEKY